MKANVIRELLLVIQNALERTKTEYYTVGFREENHVVVLTIKYVEMENNNNEN